MNDKRLRALLEDVRQGRCDVDRAVGELRHMPYEDLGFAKVDHHRELRHGMPEVILGRGKTVAEVQAISEKLLERSSNLLVTRASKAMFEAVRELNDAAEFFPRSGTVRVWGERTIHGKAKIAVVCAGTQRYPGRRGGVRDRGGDGKRNRPDLRCRRRGHSSTAVEDR